MYKQIDKYMNDKLLPLLTGFRNTYSTFFIKNAWKTEKQTGQSKTYKSSVQGFFKRLWLNQS